MVYFSFFWGGEGLDASQHQSFVKKIPGPGGWVWLLPFNTHDRLTKKRRGAAASECWCLVPLEIHHACVCVCVSLREARMGESVWHGVWWWLWWMMMIMIVWQKHLRQSRDVPCSDIRAVVETPGVCTGLVQTFVCKVILLSNLYSFDFSYRRSHVHNCSHMLTTSDGQEPFLTPKTKPWHTVTCSKNRAPTPKQHTPQDHDDLRCQVVAFLSQLPLGPKVT